MINNKLDRIRKQVVCLKEMWIAQLDSLSVLSIYPATFHMCNVYCVCIFKNDNLFKFHRFFILCGTCHSMNINT